MSKPALLFMLIALMSAGLLWAVPVQADWLTAAAKVALVFSVVLLAGALLVGKRVKFDPVLR